MLCAMLLKVNELWAGLGYYRRAKYLHSGAQHVVTELGGSFPTSSVELQKIPGEMRSLLTLFFRRVAGHTTLPAELACTFLKTTRDKTVNLSG